MSSQVATAGLVDAVDHLSPRAQVHGPARTEGRKWVRRKLVPSIVTVAAVVAGFSPPAQASTPMTATGTFGFIPISSTVIRTVGNISVYAVVGSVPYYDALTGTATDRETDIVRRNGSFVGYGTEVCTSCTLGGRTGGYTAVYTIAGLNYLITAVPFEGYLSFTGGTGGLAGLHGGGTFGGTTSNPGFYSYNYFFAP
jgi:hypothetical protein